jgi:hypothetical protein
MCHVNQTAVVAVLKLVKVNTLLAIALALETNIAYVP